MQAMIIKCQSVIFVESIEPIAQKEGTLSDQQKTMQNYVDNLLQFCYRGTVNPSLPCSLF